MQQEVVERICKESLPVLFSSDERCRNPTPTAGGNSTLKRYIVPFVLQTAQLFDYSFSQLNIGPLKNTLATSREMDRELFIPVLFVSPQRQVSPPLFLTPRPTLISFNPTTLISIRWPKPLQAAIVSQECSPKVKPLQSECGTYLGSSQYPISSSVAVAARNKSKGCALTFAKTERALFPCGVLCLVMIVYCFLSLFFNDSVLAYARVWNGRSGDLIRPPS